MRAVDGVDLAIAEGEVVGLVGESGCGKSTLGRIVAGILPPSDGRVAFRGAPIDAARRRRSASRPRSRVQMIFQDPMASLNPRLRVDRHRRRGAGGARHRRRARSATTMSCEMLRRVGLDPSYRNRYPHQFSGGQRARIGIARALAVQPKFLVCDESVAALDVSIQAQVLNLFMQLRRDLKLTYAVHQPRPRRGASISPTASSSCISAAWSRSRRPRRCSPPPNHPYTQALLANVPRLDARKQRFVTDQGRDPLADRSAARLPLPSALPARLRALPRRAARAEGDRAGPAFGLSPERRGPIGRSRADLTYSKEGDAGLR